MKTAVLRACGYFFNMKKLLFWILAILAVILFFRIASILIFDFQRLTEYGMGYLTGLIILFLLFGCVSWVLGKRLYGPSNS
ncbi:hypothetical protein [Winogradskyella aurantiaca]|uniref:hypothetical protein n=1 Tax=Winogradskyella aurantiaca TaxID=2219558 RepID=UPI001300916C|nr:hypothetical protein [Winogradskyella aurantiaca]